MASIRIPASVEEAVGTLAGVERLLVAKQWERAATVAAFVTLGEGKGKSVGNATSSISPESFAALGVAGLKSKDTVRRYVEVWESTGRPHPRPGEDLDLSGLPDYPGTWKPPGSSPDTSPNVAHIQTQPSAVAAALADPTFIAKVVERMSDDDRDTLVVATMEPDKRRREDEGRPTPGARDQGLNPLTEWLKIKAKIKALLLASPSAQLREQMANDLTLLALEIGTTMVDSDGRSVKS